MEAAPHPARFDHWQDGPRPTEAVKGIALWLALHKIIGKTFHWVESLVWVLGGCGLAAIVSVIIDLCYPAPATPSGGNPTQEQMDKKSKERREKDRKALRLRRINSLKRQIGIKEKMLEVGSTISHHEHQHTITTL